jgi:maltose alpha-D-glucosyltransferase/alpha-amylase
VDCLWLMPIYPSPLRDAGYDVSEYRNIAEAYGTLDDFKAVLEAAHARGMRIVMDLVLNHTSDEHPWFKAARLGPDSPYRDYYVWSDSDLKLPEARIIFLDTEASNWAFDSIAGQYYWHRFYASQPDLNYDNPKVQDEMISVAGFWLELGVDGLRLDAVPYLFEREGTSGENLPETHAYLRRLRAFLDRHYPDRILLCEANQWPEDVRPYFGEGDECHMGFHFPVMPRIFMALKKERIEDVVEVLRRTPPIPESCQWCTFLRNHDELTLEMVTPQQRQWMWEQYAPEPRMKLNLGIRRRLAPLLDNDRRKIELANSLLFTLPGTPIIYYGDEIGMGDHIDLPDRDGVRTPMQWDTSPSAGFTSGTPATELVRGKYGPEHVNVALQLANEDSLFHSMRRMVSVRKENLELGYGGINWVELANPAIAAYVRAYSNRAMLIVSNLSAKQQTIHVPPEYRRAYLDLLADRNITLEGQAYLEPYASMWLKALG